MATSLLMVAIFLSGLLALRWLPISALPEVDTPTIEVTTLYPGASPEVMATGITAPLERQLGQMPGLVQMSSTSSGGAAVITLRFSLSLALDVAEQQVQAALNAAANLLPPDLPMPPLYSKVNPADAPVLSVAITSNTVKLTDLHDLTENRLAPKLSQVPGVGLVRLAGGGRPAVRVQANGAALAQLGLSFEDVRGAINAANVNQAKGSFDGPKRAFAIDANDQLKSAVEYENLIIAWKNGAPLRLKDVAKVVDDAENLRLAAWSGTTPAIILNVQRQPGANVIETVDRIKTALAKLQTSLPGGVDVQVLADRTTTIRASVRDTQLELLLAVGLVVGVIFVFLRSARATLIPSVAVPLSLVGTLGVMYLAGFSINNLTLMALTISTGFVVDDAIVMIENIARLIEEGESPLQAAFKGSAQMGFTIISLTVSLLAVLIPLLFMGDVVGRLFHEFAITLAVSIVISAVVSLTLTPMMAARLLQPKSATPGTSAGWGAWSERHFGRFVAVYGRALSAALNWPRLTLVFFALTVVATAALYVSVPKGFFPAQDTGLIQVITEAEQSTSFSAMAQTQQALAAVLLQDPDVDHLVSFIGVDATNPTLNTGRMQLTLKPQALRQASSTAITARLQKAAAQVPGIEAYFQNVPDLTLEGKISKTQYQFSLSSPQEAPLNEATTQLLERLKTLPQLSGVASDLQPQGRQAYVQIDREAAGRLGVTVAGIDAALYNAFGQRLIATIYTQASQYRVVLEAQPTGAGLSALENLYVPGSTQDAASGKKTPTQIRLSTVAKISERPSTLAIHHMGQFPASTVSFNVAPGSSLGAAVQAIKTEVAQLKLPQSVEASFQGAAKAFEASLTHTVFLLLAAVLTMYIVLGVLYESTLHPITILSTLPSAGLGALLALFMAGQELGMVGVIGIVLLIGIVKKNAIMMIDFALDAQREKNLTPREAIFQACQLRFRPILMTTLAALLAALPLMLGTGVGSELRQPLGLTMVGGLIVSQLLTLFTTPVIYLALATQAQRWQRGGQV